MKTANVPSKLNTKSFIKLLLDGGFSVGAIIAVQFMPGAEQIILRAIKEGEINNLCIIENQEYLTPGVTMTNRPNKADIFAVFPSEWSHFHYLMNNYENANGALLLFDNSLAALNYADAVIRIDGRVPRTKGVPSRKRLAALGA